MPEEGKYEERYCAFVDILGFRSLVASLNGSPERVSALEMALRAMHQPHHSINSKEIDFQAQSISDAVAVSTALNPDGLAQLFHSLEGLAMDLLHQGYFIRGAVARGHLHHDANMVFGEALIKAYKVESKIASYPRIIVMRDVMMDAKRMKLWGETPNEVKRRLPQAADGPYFLDVLHGMRQDVDHHRSAYPDIPTENAGSLQRYVIMSKQIQQRFDEHTDDPKIFAKVLWFAKHWNSVIIEKKLPEMRVRGLGLDPVLYKESSLVGFTFDELT